MKKRPIKSIVFLLILAASVFVILAGCPSPEDPEDNPDPIDYTDGNSFETVEIEGELTITGFVGSEIDIAIPPSIGGVPVTAIDDNAFSDKASIESVIIPDSVETLGEMCFAYCAALESIEIPDSVTAIGGGAFYQSGLTHAAIPDSVTAIPASLFEQCESLVSVTIPGSVESIGDFAFSSCTVLDEITIPGSVRTIGSSVFQRCNALESVVIPDSVETMGTNMFQTCEFLTSVTLSSKLTSIPQETFNECYRLTSVTIPDSVTQIGIMAFFSCRGFTSFTIPSQITDIGNGAFRQCSYLESVTINPQTPPGLGEDVFGSNATGRKFYVPLRLCQVYPDQGLTAETDWNYISISRRCLKNSVWFICSGLETFVVRGKTRIPAQNRIIPEMTVPTIYKCRTRMKQMMLCIAEAPCKV